MMRALLLAASLGGAALAQAQELPAEWLEEGYGEGDVEQWSLSDLLGTVSAASRENETVFSAPATVAVITREDIHQSGARSIPDLLRRVPGVQVQQSSGQSYVVSMRGMSGLQDNNVVVLIDELPMNDIVDGSVDWDTLPVHIDDVAQIEVVRGPVSTIYGANAYSGVINIVTIPPEDAGTIFAVVGGGASVDGSPNAEAAVAGAGRISELRYRVSIHGAHDQRAGKTAASDLPQLDTVGGMLSLDTAFEGNWHLRSRIFGSFSRSDGQDHTADPVGVVRPRMMGSLQLSKMGGEGFVSGGTMWAWGQYSQITGVIGEQFSKKGTMAHAGRVGGELTLSPGSCFKLRAGVEAGLEAVSAPYLREDENDETRGVYAAYGVVDCRVNPIRVSASARGDASSLSGVQPSYRLAFVYSDDKWISARLALGSAFRNPTYIEVLGRFEEPGLDLITLEGSGSLEPQRITSAEIGFVIAPVRGLTLQPVIYGAKLEDVISENFDHLVRKTYQNVDQPGGSITMLGTELEAHYEWLDEFQPHLALSVLWWPGGGYQDTRSTAGVKDHNSTFVGSAGFRGFAVDGRLAYGANVQVATPRTYQVRSGIPPIVITRDVPTRAFLDGSIEYQPFESFPLWGWVKVQSHLPHGVIDAPLPNAAALGTSFLIGLEYRGR